jgi:hypothetical protein
MIDRTEHRFSMKPARLAGDTAYGSAEMQNWLVEERRIAPHIPVIDKSARRDGTFAREDFRYDHDNDTYTCPAGKTLTTSGTLVNNGATLLYRGSTMDCGTPAGSTSSVAPTHRLERSPAACRASLRK